jgi:peptidoglycan/xylan/chitin deacetylase (PgdA/CDA1 family)
MGGALFGLGRALTVAAATYAAPAVIGIPGITHHLHRSGGTADRTPPAVALTFDDGPHPRGTANILDLLDEYDYTATFFVIGEQLQQHPELAARIVDSGHEIGVHGWTHRCTLRTGPQRIRREIRRTATLIQQLTGIAPVRYRPPYGVASVAALLAARAEGLTTTWWTAWGRDWDQAATPSTVADLVTAQLPRAAIPIVLLHDSDVYGTRGSWQTTWQATRRLCDRWRVQGNAVVSLNSLPLENDRQA